MDSCFQFAIPKRCNNKKIKTFPFLSKIISCEQRKIWTRILERETKHLPENLENPLMTRSHRGIEKAHPE
jgi:hypothetical protein